MEELKACPFCGGKAEILKKTDKYIPDRFYPSCTVVHCIGRNRKVYFPTEATATKAWNIRKPDCSNANHDATGCLGYGRGHEDDEPIEPCIRCKEYTGNKTGEYDSL